MKLILDTPIRKADIEITELELREPTADDLIKLGYPYVLNQNEEAVFVPKIIYNWLSTLSNEPPSVIKKIPFNKVEEFKYRLFAFFTLSPEEAKANWAD
ncbi:MAG: phage tail assembly protein [Succinatimonas hippei]|nr:phage tail assembly protein [Succinatimonas hippei]